MMFCKTGVLMLALLLVASCGDKVEQNDDTGSNPETTDEPTTTPPSSNIVKTVGPIEIPFILNKSNAPVKVVVAEGETRMVKMRMEIAQETETHEEKVHSVSFDQPWLASSDITESFTLDNKGIVDILLIVDDSDSMQAVHGKLKALASNSELKLLKGIEHSNWRLAIADTQGGGCLRAVIDKNNISDYLTIMKDIEDVAATDHHERVVFKIRKLMGVIDGACTGKLGAGWFRPKSTLAIIAVTDEDHQCSWSNSPGNTGDGNTYHCTMTGDNSVDSELKKITSSGKVDWMKLYGIMDETATCGKMRQDASIGHCYASDADASQCGFTNPCASRGAAHKFRSANFAQAGFTIKDINRSDYAGIFDEVVEDINDALQDRFMLKAKPDLSESATKKFTVSINDTKVSESLYTVDANNKTLTFNNNSLQTLIADIDTPVIQVSYQVDGQVNHMHQFVIDAKADELATGDAALTLSINGAKKNKGTDYSMTRNTDDVTVSLKGEDAARKLLFPEGATATITYRVKREHYPDLVLKQTDLVFKEDGATPDLNVHVDGEVATEFKVKEVDVKLEGQNITVKKKAVVFNANHQPQHGEVVRIDYKYYTATKKLSYDDELQDKYSVDSIKCYKSSDASEVQCGHANGLITFHTDAFTRDTDIRVVMKVKGLENGQITVPDNVVTGSMELSKVTDSSTVCPEAKMVIVNGVINLAAQTATGCEFVENWQDSDNDSIYLSYKTFVPNQVVEVISGDILSYAGRYSKERWDVFIDNVKKTKDTDYTIKGRKVTFTDTQPPDTKGKVEVYLEP